MKQEKCVTRSFDLTTDRFGGLQVADIWLIQKEYLEGRPQESRLSIPGYEARAKAFCAAAKTGNRYSTYRFNMVVTSLNCFRR
jgi:hypothetical protein